MRVRLAPLEAIVSTVLTSDPASTLDQCSRPDSTAARKDRCQCIVEREARYRAEKMTNRAEGDDKGRDLLSCAGNYQADVLGTGLGQLQDMGGGPLPLCREVRLDSSCMVRRRRQASCSCSQQVVWK